MNPDHYRRHLGLQPTDTPGTRTLCATAHGEDFVTDRTEYGRLMTDLIKGGYCKTELAQVVRASFEKDDGMDRLEELGLQSLTAGWKAELDEDEAELRANAYVMTVERPGALADAGAPSLGEGSDVPVGSTDQTTETRSQLKVLTALAVGSKPGKPRMSVGRAIEYYTRVFPDVDYALYSYGSRLMVARRLNQADASINLGALMPVIGAEGDGGHGGAAVCRPESNPAFPVRQLEHVDSSNFRRYVHYLGTRLEEAGYAVIGFENRSAGTQEDLRRSGGRLAVITLIAVVIGLLLVLFHGAFGRDEIRRSNQSFLSHLAEPSASGAGQEDDSHGEGAP